MRFLRDAKPRRTCRCFEGGVETLLPLAAARANAAQLRLTTGNLTSMSQAPIFDEELHRRLEFLSQQSGESIELIVRELLGLLRMRANMPPSEEFRPWDRFAAYLATGFAEAFGTSRAMPMDTPRRKVSVFLAQRVVTRMQALTLLFQAGMYSESIPLVRSAYEDWLIASYLLLQIGEESCHSFWYEDQLRLLALSYRGTCQLMPESAVERFTDPNSKARFAKYLGPEKKKSKPLGGMQWRQIAEKVGLLAVHDCAYTLLSGLAHGSSLNVGLSFGLGAAPGAGRPAIYERNEDKEHRPAFWAFWFSLRVLTLVANEFGVSLEAVSSEFLDEIAKKEPHPTYCIAKRECVKTAT